jgi:hypothetical protein
VKNIKFDLTTPNGRKNALETLEKYSWVHYANQLSLLITAYNWVSNQISKSGPDTIEAQKKAAVDLIRAGKENNVEKMTITLDQTAGLDFGAEVDGIPIKCKIGKSGHMTIDVQYKNFSKNRTVS